MEDQLAFKQVEVLLDIHSKRIIKEIIALKEELSRTKEELRRELKEVRRQQDLPVSPQAQSQFSAPAAPAVSAEQKFQPQHHQPAAASAPIDRNGVAPSDVAIEKIFYVGNK